MENRHDQQAGQPSGQAVKERHHLSGKNAAQDNAHQKDDQRVPPGGIGQQDQGYNIGQSQLNARNGHQRRDQGFQQEYGQGNS